MIGPDFPPSPKEGLWLAVCVGVLGSGAPEVGGSRSVDADRDLLKT